MKDDIFGNISPIDALEIIRQLARTDKSIKKKIVEVAENLIRTVNVDEICEAVFDAKEMKKYIHEECPDWFEWAVSQI